MPQRPPAPPEGQDQGLERYVIPNLRNACRILRLLGSRRGGLKAAEIARQLQIPVSTTLRIMATLTLEGVVQRSDWRFELGPVLIHLGNATLAGSEIRAMAIPVLQQLTLDTMETSHLALPSGNCAVIAAVQDSPHPLRAASGPGFMADLHCSATGKVFLSYAPADRMDLLLTRQALQRRTPNTMTTQSALRREAALIRRRGYSLDNEEYHLGVRCLAAPVFGPDGSVVAAVGITASTVRFPRSAVDRMAPPVLAAAAALSARLGFGGATL